MSTQQPPVQPWLVRMAQSLPTQPRKALAALVGGLVGGLGLAIVDGSALTAPEIRQAVGGALLASVAAWRVRNPVALRALRKWSPPQRQPGPGDV